jgi:hypothetical protein
LTLIELLLGMVILAGMAGVLSVVLSSGLDLWEAGSTGSRVDDEVRSTLERIGRELRASNGSAGQITIGAGNDSIDFPLDTDNDGAFETTVRYYLDGSMLRRQENGVPVVGNPVVSDISTVTFGDPFGNSDLITVSIGVNRTRVGEKGVAKVSMRTAVGPRNN